jgi:RNA polymerase sigma-70 factor (ECF subfamily)
MFRSYRDDVHRYARKHVPEPRVDDVCGATWQDLPKALGSFRGDSSFHSWLLGIAAKKAASELRRKKNKQHDALSGVISKLCAQAPSRERPSREVARAEMDHRVNQVIEQLDADDRELLLLHYKEGQTVAEIARARGLNTNTVAQRLVRTRDRAKKLFQAALIG